MCPLDMKTALQTGWTDKWTDGCKMVLLYDPKTFVAGVQGGCLKSENNDPAMQKQAD